ncbi:CHAT domain-containing protein [Streptomyces chartreusis]|uniref:CHAT domain-containing protein n=1 Tax=Streptomyces chartreusis TaxID=1969 RepID=UPI0036AC05D3
MDAGTRDQRIARAGALYSQGNYSEALELYAAEFGSFSEKERLSKKYAAFCGNYGAVLAETGSFKQAEELFLLADVIYSAAGASADLARIWFNLGNVYTYIGSRQRTEDAFQAALRYSREVDDAVGAAHAMLGLARSLLSLGMEQVAEIAEEWLTAVEDMQPSIVDDDPLVRWSWLFQKARAAALRGEFDAASTRLRAALECLDDCPNPAYRRETMSAITQVESLQGQLPREADLAAAEAELIRTGPSRSRPVDLVSLARAWLAIGQEEQACRLYEEALALTDIRRGDLDGEERYHFTEQHVNAAHEYTFVLAQQGTPVEALAAAERGQGRALLDLMFRHQRKRQGGRAIRCTASGRLMLGAPDSTEIRRFVGRLDLYVLKFLIAGSQAVGWFLEPDGSVRSWDASAAKEPMAEALQLVPWTFPFGNEPVGVDPPPWEDFAEVLERLYKALIPESIREFLETRRGRLLVVPHGDGFHLPWSALGPPDQPLFLRWDVGVAPSVGVAMQLDRERDAQPWTGLDTFPVRASAIGGIAEQEIQVPLTSVPVEGATELLRFQALEWSAREAQRVAHATGGGFAEARDVTPCSLQLALAGSGLVHIASHGFWHPFAGDRSFIVLSPDPTTGDAALYGHQLMDTEACAELVFLSGCQTGLGGRHPDSYVSLAHSLLVSGVRTVLVSLWPIRDDSSYDTVDAFYRHLLSGCSPAGALRAMQEQFDGLLDPWDYMGFTAVGNPFHSITTQKPEPEQGMASGPIFCGGDTLVTTGSAGRILDLEIYRGERQSREEGWFLSSQSIIRIPKRSFYG